MRRYLFADESGCLTFAHGRNVSKYFILCTIHLESCDIGTGLLDLRREMAFSGLATDEVLHATSDKQVVRDKVFDFISRQDFRIDATILEKSKAQPQIKTTEDIFYKHAWYYHFKHVAPKIVLPGDELFLSAASIGTKGKKSAFRDSVNDVARQILDEATWETIFWPAASDPCLQVADYCAWAIQKKWEHGDVRSYNLIRDKIHTEYDLWMRGTTHYY